MNFSELLNLAISAAQTGGAVTKKYFGKLKEISHKPDAGLVTVADKEAEEEIIKIIHSKFPDHQIYAEESGEQKTESNVRWIIDPLDGTTNYAHGTPLYCVSIGVEVDGELVVGVIDAPMLNEQYVGVKGEGATLNGEKIKVSEISSINDGLLATGFSYKKNERIIGEELRRLGEVLRSCRAVRRLGAAALDMAYVAAGRYDGFWEVDLSPWDVAGGAVIIREAGGKLTNFSGGPFDPFEKQVLASNNKIHDQLQSILNK